MNRRQFVLSGLAAIILPGAATAETFYVDDTNDGFLNLRTGPGTTYAVVKRIYGGTGVDVVGRSGSWRRLVLPDGTSGWASGNFMSRRYVPQRRYDATVNPTSDGFLNMRTGPGTNYAIIQRLYAGQGLYVTGGQGRWLNVQLPDGTRGWTSSRFVNF